MPTSSISVRSFVSRSKPNSNLVSARIRPFVAAPVAIRSKMPIDSSLRRSYESVADELARLVGREGHVVALRGLRRRGEDRLGQLLGLDQTLRQRDAAHDALALVLRPPAAGQVAAHDAFHRDDVGGAHERRAPGQLGVGVERRREPGAVGRQHVVRHEVARLLEPVQRARGQHAPLVRDRRRQHHVERADAVGGDQQQPVVACFEDVADLALGYECHDVLTSMASSRSNKGPRFMRKRWGSNRASSDAASSRVVTSGSAVTISRKLASSSQAAAAARWTIR